MPKQLEQPFPPEWLSTLSSKLNTFILQGPDYSHRSQWLRLGPLSVYLRKSRRPIGLSSRTPITGLYVLEIANMECNTASRGKGNFTAFLIHLTATYLNPPGLPGPAVASTDSIDAIYVENILNHRLTIFLARWGFLPCNEHLAFEGSSCMVKLSSRIIGEQ